MAAADPPESPRQLAALTAEELACRAQKGSKASFTELVNRYGPRLHGYFSLKVESREDCEDLVQETLVKAYRNLDRYEGTRPFTTWIFTIGVRRAVDYFRARERRRMVPIPRDLPGGRNPFDSAVRRDEKRTIWTRARTLPKRQFDALWLHYAEDLPIKEIAGILGVSRIHAKVMLYRARARLAKLQGVRRTGARAASGKDEAIKEMLSC